MSDKEEQLRKKMELDQANLKAEEAVRIAAEQQRALKAALASGNGTQAATAEDDAAKQQTDQVGFKPTKTKKSDWELLLEAYRSKYGREPELNKQGEQVLMFASREEANNFFKEQAAKNIAFLSEEVDANGKPTGYQCFSAGNDGKLYHGTSDEIRQQLAGNPEGLAKYNEQMPPVNAEKTEHQKNAKESLAGLRSSDEPAPEAPSPRKQG